MWPIQSYNKFALSLAYFPASNDRSATRHLNRKIQGNPELCNALQQAGYSKHQHYFSARQVELIFRYLGNP